MSHNGKGCLRFCPRLWFVINIKITVLHAPGYIIMELIDLLGHIFVLSNVGHHARLAD